MAELFQHARTDGFSFEPALPPAELIQNHRIVSRFKRSTIVSYGGSYVLRGNGKLINFLYDAGLGSKTHRDSACLILNHFPTFKHFILPHFLRTAFQPFHADAYAAAERTL